MRPGGSDEQLRRFLADFWSFLMSHTGMPPYRVPLERTPSGAGGGTHEGT
jgi:hypothetical protein